MRLARVLVVVVVMTGVLALAGGPAANAIPQTDRFEFTGGVQNFVVPEGVTAVQVEACGAEGGVGADLDVPAGLGAMVVASLAVQPGETLEVRAGGQGGDGTDTATDGIAPGGAGGFNGGGDGGAVDSETDVRSGGGGGGVSDVRQGGSELTDRAVAAGGGGGSGGQGDNDDAPEPGPGGDGGLDGDDGGNERGGGGGTQTTGGFAGATQYGDPEAGVLGVGGVGGDGEASNSRGGGGAGGGFYGGGGGGAGDLVGGGGGGGGSSLAAGGVVTDGVCAGNGYVAITYDVPAGAAPAPAPLEVTFTG